MALQNRSRRSRGVRPELLSLEGRTLLNAATPHHAHDVHVLSVSQQNNHQNKPHGPVVTIINKVSNGGFVFTNFDGPNAGTNAAAGTNMNGISNSGTSVGFTIANANNGNLNNFTANPLKSTAATTLNINGSTTAMAFGINSAGTVVGTDGNGNAFYLHSHGAVKTFIPTGGTSVTAFGINDHSTIVGQYVTSTATPGFIRVFATPGFIRVNPKSQ